MANGSLAAYYCWALKVIRLHHKGISDVRTLFWLIRRRHQKGCACQAECMLALRNKLHEAQGKSGSRLNSSCPHSRPQHQPVLLSEPSALPRTNQTAEADFGNYGRRSRRHRQGARSKHVLQIRDVYSINLSWCSLLCVPADRLSLAGLCPLLLWILIRHAPRF